MRMRLSKKVIIFLFAAAMILIPLINLFGAGEIFSWHITQKNFSLGGVQCIVFVLAVFLMTIYKKEKAEIIILASAALFMIMQGIIIPCVTVYLYFEMICFIGFAINCKGNKKKDLIYNFVSGLIFWGGVAIICSLLGFGTINNLRIMTLLMVVIAFFLHKESYEFMPVKFAKYIQRNKKCNLSLLFILLIITICLILAAKSNVARDFDSVWYMLKPEYMLVGEHSFYDYLGYSAFVHYYPKLVELFFLPISGLGDYSFILIANVFVYTLFIVLGYKMVSLLCRDCKESNKLLFVLLMFTMPSLTGIVSTGKGDTFGAFLVFAGVWFFINFLQDKELFHLVFVLISLLLSTGTKLTFILWGGCVGIILSIYCLFWLIRNRHQIKTKINKYDIGTLVSGLVFIGGIHYRTYKLTGYPTYPLWINVWNKLGFSANYAMKDVANPGMTIPVDEMGNRAYEFFFDPSALEHTVMCWPTNIALIWIAIVFICCIGKKLQLNLIAKILLVISVVELAFSIYYILVRYYPDGNYFFFPFLVLCFTCFYLLYLQKDGNALINSRFMRIIMCMMLFMTIPLTFVANCAWASGIKPFSTEIIGDNFSDYKEDELAFRKNGYYNIAKFIETEFANERVIISGSEMRIKGAVENANLAFNEQCASKEIYSNYENFKEYVQYAQIKGFVLSDSDETFFREYVLRLISEVTCERVMEDETATLYIVSY